MNALAPQLVIISGPSGAGKSTVLRTLLGRCPLPLQLSVSATTRAPRPGEQDGVDYFFLTPEEFGRRREQGQFLECKEVYGRGHWYGTLASQVATGLEAGKWVILEIDVEGAKAVIEQRPEAITIFVHPGSMTELERRLRDRGTETEESIRRRLEVAACEMAAKGLYRHEVINHELEQAADQICRILSNDSSLNHDSTVPGPN
ncbi:MAG: guanylate kinase [Planctomycetales bacterium]|nr:guanylate kinase [Planctomycetales bacterium]